MIAMTIINSISVKPNGLVFMISLLRRTAAILTHVLHLPRKYGSAVAGRAMQFPACKKTAFCGGKKSPGRPGLFLHSSKAKSFR